MDWTMLPALLALGAAVGFLAGLLGIGGGLSMIPLLTIVFSARAFPPGQVVHIAVATSTATMMFTAASSAHAHARRGGVLWGVVLAMAPGIVLGSLVGPQIAAALSGRVLAALLGVFTWTAATRMLVARGSRAGRTLPAKPALFGVAAGIGILSSIAGAGGAFITVPYLGYHNVKIHNAVATSAALGFPIAVAATIGYVIAGWREAGLPPWSLGFVYLPAMIVIMIASVSTAPIGAAMAHLWNAQRLRRAFAVLLYALGAYMFWKALRG
jgi:uncharacterized membrane protein YfcA